MSTSTIPLALTLLAALLPAARAEDDPVALTEPERRLVARLLPREGSLDAYLERLAADRTQTDRDAGFGGRRMRLHAREGRLAASLSVAAHRGQLVAVEIRIGVPDEHWPALSEPVIEAGRGVLSADDTGAEGRWSSPEPLSAWTREIDEALGEGPVIDLDGMDEDLVDAHLTLVSPLRWYPVGASFGYAGVEPDGLVAAKRLRKAGATALLSDALRGLNPEGRVFAALQLQEHAAEGGRLSDEDRRAVGAIRRSDVPIELCHGCNVHVGVAADAFPSD